MFRSVWIVCLTLVALVGCSAQQKPIAQVHLSWSENPQTTISITWQSSTPLSRPMVQYGAGNALSQTAIARRVRYAQETGPLYQVTLRNLKPDTVYSYRVGDESKGWSEVRTFRTAPAEPPARFVFTAFADHGVTPAAQQNVQRVLAGERPAFHIIMGDLSYANGNQPIWDQWFDLIEPLASQVPLMVCPGNHEDERNIGFATYLARFALLGKELYYRFDYGGARFILFNSQHFRDAEQLRWFEQELREARRDQKVRWVIVSMHHPLYSSTVNRLNDAARIEVLQPLFDRYRPDLVLLGHHHNYERTYPLIGMKPVSKHLSRYRKGEGVIFVTSGGGGKSLYDQTSEQPAFTAKREKCYQYLRLTVSDKSLKVECYRTENNSLLDRFEIVR
jgi:predicted MPP superfamily phosphohydrolase